MKRKIVSALLVMSMAASLVACGNSGSGSSDPADESVSVSSSASSESDASASASSESEAEAEESEMPEGYDETSTELYNEALGDFNDALATAKEAETVDERYALMAVAEGKLMESAMMTRSPQKVVCTLCTEWLRALKTIPFGEAIRTVIISML